MTTTSMLSLPKEILGIISHFLRVHSLLNFRLTCVQIEAFTIHDVFERCYVDITHVILKPEYKDVFMRNNNYNHIRHAIWNTIVPFTPLSWSLESIWFGKYYNETLDYLPKTLRCLTLGSRFSQSVDNLPSTLTSLTFLPEKNKYERIHVNHRPMIGIISLSMEI